MSHFTDGFETGDVSMWEAESPALLPATYMTADKNASSLLIDGLQPSTEYQFVVRTIMEPHAQNQNQVISTDSEVVIVTTLP